MLTGLSLKAQDVELPVDFRQHNLTEYNSSLFSPVFSLDRNQPQSVAFWSRWQWQTVDGDPTTLFLNYSTRISPSMAGGIAFFQQNTGVFLHTGGALNYAFTTRIATGLDLSAGVNLFGYQRQIADDRFQINPDINLPQFDETKDFIIQLAPSIQLEYHSFRLGMVVENLLEYNLRSNENQVSSNGNIYIGYLGTKIPVNLFAAEGSSYLQPTVYVKQIPDFEDQVGITALFSTPRFWVQGGYNSFYGVSGGVGGRFFKNFSIGALVEYGTQGDLQDQDPTFELITAFNFGRQFTKDKTETDLEQEVELIGKDIPEGKKEPMQVRDMDEVIEDKRATPAPVVKTKRQKRLDRKRKRDSLEAVKKMQDMKLAEELAQRQRDSIATLKREEQIARAQQRQDSIDEAQEALKVAAQKKRDSLRAVENQTVVTPLKGEKYEEAVNEEGLEPGYYLIANVFRTKRYYDAFMKSLSDRGLNPKSFFRASRNYNYVYLGKYDSVREAREARDSQLGGKYTQDLWIFRVVIRE